MKNSIKVKRAIEKFTQTDLADKIGVSRQTIHAIESGKYTPSLILALKMASVFKCKIEDIFELENDDWA